MYRKSSNCVSFVVPALNEEDIVQDVIHDIWSQADALLNTFELILINDGSTDKTGQIMDQSSTELSHVRVLHNQTNKGLGEAYKKGLAEAQFEYVMMLCGDGGLPASNLPHILEKIGEADIIIPYMTNLRKIKSPFRYLISRSYTGLLNLIFGYSLEYYNGLPLHKTKLVRALDISSGGFGFQGEIIIKLLKSNHTFAEVACEGAEKTSNSTAFRLKNLFSVGFTFLHLIKNLRGFRG